MVNHFLIGIFFTGLLATAQAQPIPTTDSLNSLTIAQKDTLRALHRLFQARRRGGSTMRAVGFAEVGVNSYCKLVLL